MADPATLDAPTPPAPATGVRDALARLRGMLARHVALDGLLLAGFVAVGGAGFGLALDVLLFRVAGIDGVLDLPWAVRATGLALVLGAALGVVGYWVVYRRSRTWSDVDLALLLERRFPDLLGERLITAVELADGARAGHFGYSKPLVARTLAEADDLIAGVPLLQVFDRRRLRRRALVLLGMVLLLGGEVFVLAAAREPARAGESFGRAAVGLALDWADRNILLRHTPWPRSAHLEWAAPASAETRIAQDAKPPELAVRAHEWVVADHAAPFGWRPLLVSDLPALGVDSSELSGASFDEAAARLGPDHPAVVAAVAGLDRLANEFGHWQSLRRLPPPGPVSLRYGELPKAGPRDAGTGTRGELTLSAGTPGLFEGELAGLKESVSYAARAGNFRTPPRQLVLVPPPRFGRLYRVERQPAYLFHPAPVGMTAAEFAGLRQRLPEQDVSLTGERSVATVPAGTELELVAVLDRPVATATVLAKAGRVPASAAIDGSSVRVNFAGPDRLDAAAGFELVVADADGVTARRTILIQVADDRPPSVELAVEGLRKLGGGYLVTPQARAPLVKESQVSDDHGLARVEYQFTATRLETAAVQALQAQVVAGLVSSASPHGSVGAVAGPLAASALVKRLASGDAARTATIAFPAFERASETLRRQTPAGLAALLSKPLAAPPEPLVREIRLNLDTDAFDLQDADAALERLGARMRVPDRGEAQPRYALEASLVATDTNVLTGPKAGRNLEPLKFTVVSEADLLVEVTKDEEAAAARFDEAIKKLSDAQAKLSQQAERLTGVTSADLRMSARVRAEDIVQDVAKVRDLVTAVQGAYGVLAHEVELNRCDPSVGRRYESAVLSPLAAVLAGEFAVADSALAKYRDGFTERAVPAPPLAGEARGGVAALLARLEAIRRGLGETLSVAKLRDDLKRIIDNQGEVTAALKRLQDDSRARLFAPELLPVPPQTLKVGARLTVAARVDWKLYDKGELTLRLEAAPGGELVVPGELKIKDDSDQFEFEVRAGSKPGKYAVKVVPSAGRAIVIEVTVQ